MKLSVFQESLELQRDGAPIFVGDAVFYVRRFGTPESQEFLRNLRKKLFGPLYQGQITDEVTLMAEWLVEYGVVGWDGVLQESATEDQQFAWREFFESFKQLFGKKKPQKPEVAELPYSKKAARNIFTNPEYWLSLNNILVGAAMNFEHYLLEQAEEDIAAIKK